VRKQGKRSDLDAPTAHVVAAVAKGESRDDVMRTLAHQWPEEFLKFGNKWHLLYTSLQAKPAEAEEPQWRKWQKDVISMIDDGSQGPRRITWIYDRDGGAGKSLLVNYLVRKGVAVSLGGKLADMSYIFASGPKKVALFDITRTGEEFSKHLCSMAEMLKNGSLTSTKYESRTVIFDPCTVIFFANFPAPEGVWSQDRYDQWDVEAPLSIYLPGAERSGPGGRNYTASASPAVRSRKDFQGALDVRQDGRPRKVRAIGALGAAAAAAPQATLVFETVLNPELQEEHEDSLAF